MTYIADGNERILVMQPIMNADCDKFGTLINEYAREYLGRINIYPKTLQDVYDNKHKNLGQNHPSKIGISCNTTGEESREYLVNAGATHLPYSRCSCTNHSFDKCVARKYADGTMLHNMGKIKEVEYEMNNEVCA